MTHPDTQLVWEELARRGRFDAFVDATFLSARPRFDWNWHHQLLAAKLQQIAEHSLTRLIVCMPPRHGKSQLVTRQLPAWYMGKHPAREIITASYGMDLSRRMAKDTARVLDNPAYRRIFPEHSLKTRTAELFRTPQGGGLFATSTGAAIVGMGANLLIVDDPTKSRAEVESQAQRDKLWEWWMDDATSRLQFPNSVVLMGTRYHDDDLIGRVLKYDPPGTWEVITLPAIAEEPVASYDPRQPGQILWPAERGGPLTEEQMLARRHQNPYGFASLYQQRPTLRQGGMFEPAWFDRISNQSPSAVAQVATEVIISVDAALGGGSARTDPTAIVVGARVGQNIHILDVVNARLTYTQVKDRIRSLAQQWPMAAILIEEASGGVPLISDLQSEHPRVIPFAPENRAKIARWQYSVQRFEAGSIYLPDPRHSPWRSEFVDQHLGAGSVAHDDMIDALAQLCIYWSRKRNVQAGRLVKQMDSAQHSLTGVLARMQGALGRFGR